MITARGKGAPAFLTKHACALKDNVPHSRCKSRTVGLLYLSQVCYGRNDAQGFAGSMARRSLYVETRKKRAELRRFW